MRKKRNILVIDDTNKILDVLDTKSPFMKNYIKENTQSSYCMIYKYVSYADLPTFAKRNKQGQSMDKDLLTYLTVDEMENTDGFYEMITKQSNINMPKIFFEKLGIKQLQRRVGHQDTEHDHILVNNYASVSLVNDTLGDFTYIKTKKIFDKLGKNVTWNAEECEYDLNEGDLTPIDIHHAIHGIGIKEDILFHKLRHNIFKNDIIMMLIESRCDGTKKLFVLLNKNPKFYSIIHQTNTKWQQYLEIENKKTELNAINYIDKTEEKNRKMQNKWRNLLAEEIANYTVEEDEVFCIFTMIKTNFKDLGTLFRASHIKRFEECNSSEAYDINNGLLLCANADALFDKFLITVSEDKTLIFSFLLEHNYLLREQLQLTEKIFTYILNEERMKYLSWHRSRFYQLEEERKK